MRNLVIRTHSRASSLGLIGLLVALATAGSAAAEALCPSFPVASLFEARGRPNSIALADLDGDHIPDLVNANGFDVSVLRGNGDGSFQAAVPIAAGGSADGIAVADLDRDGIPDLVTANYSSDEVNVLLGNGDGTFQPAVAFATGDGPSSVAVADFNGDSIPDLVTGDRDLGYDADLSVLLGNGDGSFQAAVSFPLNHRAPNSVAVADFDGDGAFDLVAANNRGADVLLGNGDGSFQAAIWVRPGRYLQPTSLTVADLNGDQIPDLVMAGNDVSPYPYFAEGVDVLLGNGDGSFQAAVGFPAGPVGSSVAAADLDGDGDSDIVVVDEYNDRVDVLLGNGDGSLQSPIYFATRKRSRPEIIAVADLDGDGNPDLVTGDAGPDLEGEVSVLLGHGDGSFQATPSYPVIENPYFVAVADLDGDSVPDLVTASDYYYYRGKLRVLLGNGDGSYRPAFGAADHGFFSVAVADLDGDGIPDLVTGSQDYDPPSPPAVYVLLGNGDATFREAIPLAIGALPRSFAIADLDGDSDPDIVAAGGNVVSVLLGNGDGSFQAAVPFATGDRPASVAVADFDGDSIPDLVTANNYSNDVSVLLGNGDGSFRAAVSFAAGTNPSSVAVADFDGDGVSDLAISNYTSNDVSVLLGNGDGSFQAPVSNAVGFAPNSVAAGDLNGDSIPDIVTADSATSAYSPSRGSVSVLLGNGDGSFQAAVAFESGRHPVGVAVADLDGDRVSDIAVAGLGTGDVTVLINQCEPPALPVDVDIMPGSELNPINLSREGVVPVAVLGSESFDVADVDGATLSFGPNDASLAHWRGPHFEDVNGDGVMDLLAHFRVEETGIAFGDRLACLSGATLDGTRFGGCDSVRTVPDMDGDRLLDVDEAAIGTNALRADTDGDGHDDGAEVYVLGTDPLDPLDPPPAVVRERGHRRGRRR